MSRAGQSWGIPLPFDPTNVVYVWFDALINYAAAVGYGTDDARCSRRGGRRTSTSSARTSRASTTVVWPAMLMSAGLPRARAGLRPRLAATSGGERMSKSLGTSVDPPDVVARFGADPLRLYLTKEITYGGDGDFTWERYEERYNADLANNLGNLVSRVAAMAESYRGGRLTPAGSGGRLAEVASAAVARYSHRDGRASRCTTAAAAVVPIVDATNEFIAETRRGRWPRTRPTPGGSTKVLFDAAEAVRVAAVLLTPVMPSSCRRDPARGVGAPTGAPRLDADGPWRVGAASATVTKAAALVAAVRRTRSSGRARGGAGGREPRRDPWKQTPEGRSARGRARTALRRGPQSQRPSSAPAAPRRRPHRRSTTSRRCELKVAKVLAAEAGAEVEEADQAARWTWVEPAPRTILAGIAEAYQPEQLGGADHRHRGQPEAAPR